MNTEHMKKLDRLLFLIHLFESNPQRPYRTREIADRLGINEDTANDYLKELHLTGLLPITNDKRHWFLPAGAVVPRLELSLSYAEATGLYLAGRLLSQTQDEQNLHITLALKKLVEALPPALRDRQQMLLDLLLYSEHPENQLRDMSHIFQALASGWIMQRRVRISYTPPTGKNFDCFFDPYLLEPSAIGRTIYVIGFSSAVNDLRVFKLERIVQADLTEEPFTISEKFKGPEMLHAAWGVMYHDEPPVTVLLRFSHTVTQRVHETRWHPSQKLTRTREGCEWQAFISDTLEIEPWIRGWGGDCEVVEPSDLRESIIQHFRKGMRTYGLATEATPHQPRSGAFNPDLFRKE